MQVFLIFSHGYKSFLRNNADIKKQLVPRMIKLWKSNKTRGKGANLPGVINCGKLRNILGKLIEDKSYFSRFVCTDQFQHCLPVSGDKNVLSFLVQEEHLSHGKIMQESFLHLLFLNCLQFKMINMQSGIFWGKILWIC